MQVYCYSTTTVIFGDRLTDSLTIEDLSKLQALADFQMALSAFDFICELEEGAEISRIERRRYRCLEDAAVVAYCRPFISSRGLPVLSFKKIGVKPTDRQLELHSALRSRRNQVIAHSDLDRVRLAFKTKAITRDPSIKFPVMDFDDSLAFFGERWELIDWLRMLIGSISEKLFELAQASDEISFRQDHISGPDSGE